MVVGADAPNPTGRPKQFEKGKHTTFAVWESDGVWHLRTSTKTPAKGKAQRVRFSGTVTVNGDKILNGEFQGLEKKPKAKEADFVYVYPNARSFDFQFSTESTNVDGLTFKVGPKAESVTFKLLTAGDDDPKRVMVGAKGVHPAKAEFTIPVPQPK
jgi:hypothetical protein